VRSDFYRFCFDLSTAPAHIKAMTQTMTHVPQIFDTPLVHAHMRRAFAMGPADFLLTRAVEDMADRLDVIMRPFPAVLDLATPLPLAGAVLAGHERQITRAAFVPTGADDVVLSDETLPFAPESFDLCVSLLALQSINDLPGFLVHIRRVLRPDGLFLGCLLGGQSLMEVRHVLARAEEEIRGGVSPRVAPFADVRDMGGLLQRAGFTLPVSDSDRLIVRYDHAFAVFRDLRAMGATNALTARSKMALRRDIVMRAAELYHELYGDEDGRVRLTFELIWVSGWAAHESQQKPLKPGSAQMRLADALGVVEGQGPQRGENNDGSAPAK
jgi:SAM-dependent methyltransferase